MDIQDFVVIGDSLAASSALDVLVADRMAGFWLDDARDSGGLDNLASVLGPDGEFRTSGADLRQSVLDSAAAMITEAGVATEVELVQGVIRITTLSGETISARYVIAAPFGTELDPPASLGAEAYYGLGISNDAAADSPFYMHMPVVVWGGGYRAAEQALIAARHAESVTVVSDEGIAFLDLEGEVGLCPNVSVREVISILSVIGDEKGRFSGLVLVTDRGPEQIDASAMFLARGLEFSAGIYGGEGRFNQLVRSGRVVPAGMAAGVPHHQRAKSIESGYAAAGALMTKFGLR